MNADELVAEFRNRADDEVEPFLFSTEKAMRYANEGEREACVRAQLLWDDESSFLTFALVAGKRDYVLDERIDRIESVTYSPAVGSPCALCTDDSEDLFDGLHHPDRMGRPVRAARRGKMLRLWPTPTLNHLGAVRIACYRFPLQDMVAPTDTPEIHVQHHDGLVDWMLHRAFSRPDADAKDDPRSIEALALFTQRFGERPTANVLRRHREQRRVTTRYGGL